MKRKLVFLAVFLMGNFLRADTLSLSFVQNMTDNLFQNRDSESDQVSSMSFSVDKNWNQFSLFAAGDYSYLFENSHVAYSSLELGIDYLLSLGAKTAVYFSLTGSGTFYKRDYSDFNYIDMNAFAALKSYISQTSIVKSHYSFEHRSYQASLFDFWSHSLFLSVDKYFQSKTTLKAELNWGYKYFMHPYQDVNIELQPGLPSFQRGTGKGKHHGGSDPVSQPGQSGGEGIQVFSLSSLAAQSLGAKVGLNIVGTRQWILSGQNPFDSVHEFYLVENPSYDRFSWEGYQLGSQLTLLIPWTIELKIGYTYSDKKFPGIESYSLEEEPLGNTRRDLRGRIDVGMTKNFARISVFLSYSFVDNRSNDPFFDWNGHFFSVGFSWNHFYGGRQ